MTFYYIYILIIVFLIIIIYFSFYRKEDENHIEDDAFNKLNIAKGIIDFLNKEGIDTAKYSAEYQRCKKMLENRNYVDSTLCSENLLKSMEKDNLSLELRREEGNFKICKNCGEKVYGNYIFCPKCGGPL